MIAPPLNILLGLMMTWSLSVMPPCLLVGFSIPFEGCRDGVWSFWYGVGTARWMISDEGDRGSAQRLVLGGGFACVVWGIHAKVMKIDTDGQILTLAQLRVKHAALLTGDEFLEYWEDTCQAIASCRARRVLYRHVLFDGRMAAMRIGVSRLRFTADGWCSTPRGSGATNLLLSNTCVFQPSQATRYCDYWTLPVVSRCAGFGTLSELASYLWWRVDMLRWSTGLTCLRAAVGRTSGATHSVV